MEIKKIKKIKKVVAGPFGMHKTKKSEENRALIEALYFVDPIICVFQNEDGTIGYYRKLKHKEMEKAVKTVMRVLEENNG